MLENIEGYLLSSCLPHTPQPMLSTTHGGVTFPTLGGSLRDWTMRNSTSPASCLPLLLRYMLNPFFFFSFSFAFFVMGSNGGKLVARGAYFL